MMSTADMALKMDPAYEKISKRFHKNPEEFAEAFSKAWHKLTHRDMGPYVCGLGSLMPSEAQLWQDPVPDVDHELISEKDASELKSKLLASGLTVSQLVSTAWASAATFRGSDKRGGANGARIRLAPQKDWAVNNPVELSKVLQKVESIQKEFNNAQPGSVNVSIADLIVLGGNAGIEKAALDAGNKITVPFSPGRTDATQDNTDVESVNWLEPKSDGFRNHLEAGSKHSATNLLIDRAQLLTLSAPEMTVLIGGLRVLNVNTGQSRNGVLTSKPETLTNDFFVNLLDMSAVAIPTGFTNKDLPFGITLIADHFEDRKLLSIANSIQ